MTPRRPKTSKNLENLEKCPKIEKVLPKTPLEESRRAGLQDPIRVTLFRQEKTGKNRKNHFQKRKKSYMQKDGQFFASSFLPMFFLLA